MQEALAIAVTYGTSVTSQQQLLVYLGSPAWRLALMVVNPSADTTPPGYMLKHAEVLALNACELLRTISVGPLVKPSMDWIHSAQSILLVLRTLISQPHYAELSRTGDVANCECPGPRDGSCSRAILASPRG